MQAEGFAKPADHIDKKAELGARAPRKQNLKKAEVAETAKLWTQMSRHCGPGAITLCQSSLFGRIQR